jgi:hypothetical protein
MGGTAFVELPTIDDILNLSIAETGLGRMFSLTIADE